MCPAFFRIYLITMSILDRLFGKKQPQGQPSKAEREPNQNEVLVPVDYDISDYAGDAQKEWFGLRINAVHRGYTHFIVPREQYEQARAAGEEQKTRDALLNKTAELNTIGIELEKEGKIEDAIKVYEENAALGYKATHAYNRLMVLYHRLERYDDERRIINRTIEVFGDSKELQRRLQKLDNTYVKPTSVYPTSASSCVITHTPLGDEYQQIKKQFDEFEFYTTGRVSQMSMHTPFMDSPLREEIWRIQKTFAAMIAEAKDMEDDGDFIGAAVKYEGIVAEHYYLPTPYDRLIIIYSKAKLKKEEKRVLQFAIDFFTALRDKQREYITALAEKYGKTDFVRERIEQGKKITYYGGAFELYNPYPIIEKWKQRLNKLG